MDNEARILLDDVIAFCRRDGRETRLINMLEQCGATGFDDESLTIQVPSRFAYNYLVKQRELIERYLEEISFMPMVLNVVVAEGGAPSETQTPTAAATPTVPVTAAAASLAPAGDGLPQRAAEVPTSFAEAPASPFAPAEPVATSEPTVAAPAKSEPISKSGVTVRNTVSPEAFRKMMDEMRSQDPTGKRQNVTAPQQPAATHAPVGQRTPQPQNPTPLPWISTPSTRSRALSRATKTATPSTAPCVSPPTPRSRSSARAYSSTATQAWARRTCSSPSETTWPKKKPYIRVKYANSQAYLDDYMNELGAQRGPGNLIMREYRDADILIIDDVQNIVGKQASVEFFFQLVDSFIREGKKIALASDRAPKDLAMDERLTSRFSSGMLCLVSEPGFEMKYVILKRYYESIIQQDEDLTSMNVDTSLLQALPSSEGKLTDEHLRHMAEISGNNIRSLESFCERCANLSSEREAAGAELTAEDIDRVAKIYFNTAHKIIHVDTVQRVVEEFYHVSHEELVGKRRTANIAFARHVAVYLANNLCEMTTPAIGAEFGGRDHSTVLNSLKVVENKMREDRRIVEDIQNLKNTILLKS